MSSLPPRGTSCVHAPPLEHLDTDASSRCGHTSAPAAASGEQPWRDAMIAYFQSLYMIKPRFSSWFTQSDRLNQKGPTTIRDSCTIHATVWGCERNARTWCRGSSWQGTAGKTFLWDYVTTSSETRTNTTLARAHQCPRKSRSLLPFSASAHCLHSASAAHS